MKIRPITTQDVPTIAEYEKEISLISFGDEAITDLVFHQQKLTKAMPKEDDGSGLCNPHFSPYFF